MVVAKKAEAGLCEALADWLEITCFSLQQLLASEILFKLADYDCDLSVFYRSPR